VSDEDLRAALADVARRLAAAEAVLAIQALKARYGELVDRRFERGAVVPAARLAELGAAIAELFTEDGVWDGGPVLGVAEGRAAIAARLAEPTLVFSRHLFVSPSITVEGDRARGRWELLAPCKDAAGRSYWMCGIEEDEYARDGLGVWRHARMTLTTVTMAPVGEGFDQIWC